MTPFLKKRAALKTQHAFWLPWLFIQILQFLYKIFMHSFFCAEIGEKREKCYNIFTSRYIPK